jgi:hypothetical protein
VDPGTWVRGGAWINGSDASVLFAGQINPSSQDGFFGFRCAR